MNSDNLQVQTLNYMIANYALAKQDNPGRRGIHKLEESEKSVKKVS